MSTGLTPPMISTGEESRMTSSTSSWDRSAAPIITYAASSSWEHSAVPTVPRSWHTATPPTQDNATESVHERIQREIGEMKARIIIAQYDGEKEHDASLGRIPTSRLMRQDEPKLVSDVTDPSQSTAEFCTSQTPDIPPGLPHRQVSIFEAIKTGSVDAEVYTPSAECVAKHVKTPATEYFDMETSPGSAKSTCTIETQTDVTLSITLEMITWTPSVLNVIEKTVEGPDAKLELAIRAQQQDILPELEAPVYDTESSGDESASDSDAAEEEETSESEAEEASKLETHDEEPAIEDEALTPAAGEVRVVEMIQQIEHNLQSKDAETPAPPSAHAETRPEKKRKNSKSSKKMSKPLMALDATKRKSKFMPHPNGCKGECCGSEVPTTKNAASHDPLMAVDSEKQKPKLLKLRRGITMDTGAHDNVMPARMAGKRRVRPSPGSKRGMSYVAAGNEKIKNEGEIDFDFQSVEGHISNMVFQIANVNKALGSVAYSVDRAYRVVFDKNMETGEDMSYMTHKPTKKT